MSIDKIYSSLEMTRVELGKYVPEVKAEVIDLYKQEDRMHAIFVKSFALALSAGGVAIMLCATFGMMNLPVNSVNLAVVFASTTPVFVGGCVAMVMYGIKSINLTNKIIDEESTKADRAEDLQNEANRLWVKREQIRALKDNNNTPFDFDEQLKIIEEKFGISPNVNSEESYLAYWANPNNKV